MVNELLNDLYIKKVASNEFLRKVYTSFLKHHKLQKCIIDMSTARLCDDVHGRINANILLRGVALDLFYDKAHYCKKENVVLVAPKKTFVALLKEANILESNQKHEIWFVIESHKYYRLEKTGDTD